MGSPSRGLAPRMSTRQRPNLAAPRQRQPAGLDCGKWTTSRYAPIPRVEVSCAFNRCNYNDLGRSKNARPTSVQHRPPKMPAPAAVQQSRARPARSLPVAERASIGVVEPGSWCGLNALYWLFWEVLFDATPDASSYQAKPAPALSLDVLPVSSRAALRPISKPSVWLFWEVLFDATPDASPPQLKPASALSLDVFTVRSTAALSKNTKPSYRLCLDVLPVSTRHARSNRCLETWLHSSARTNRCVLASSGRRSRCG